MKKHRPPDAWIVQSTFRPGEKGTKKLVRDWGDRLLYVRYRYNALRSTRLKTVEIVVTESPWRHRTDSKCAVEIRSWEKSLRDALVAAGGKWDRDLRVWVLEKRKVHRLGLGDRARKVPRPVPPPP